MKHLPLLCLLTITLVCCKKESAPPPADNPSPDLPSIPASSPINTGVSAYVLDNYAAATLFYLYTNKNLYTYSPDFRSYNIANTLFDKYSSSLNFKLWTNSQGTPLEEKKVFTVLSPVKNYLNLKLFDPKSAGFAQFYGTIDLRGNGQLVIPPGSFEQHSGLSVYASYLHPSITDYAVTLPCYPMADDNGKRWFLNSYGLSLLVLRAGDYVNYDADFIPGSSVILKMPITASQLNAAPDSIPAWFISLKKDDLYWKKNGYAYKVNDHYEKIIDKKGYWNLAVPVDGVYITLHIRTSDGVSVPNTRYLIKSGSDEISEGRTDAEGNALAFVPANKGLSIDIVNDLYVVNTYSQNIDSFKTASEKTIIIPDKADIGKLEGHVFNCDGSVFGNGIAVLSIYQAKDDYATPITNGHFRAANWLSGGYRPTTVKIYDAAGNFVQDTKLVLGFEELINANFYNCANSSQLYCNYVLDGVKYELKGDTLSSSPVLTASKNSTPFYRFTVDDNGKGISFDYLNQPIGILGVNFKVNNTTYTYQTEDLIFSRDDTNVGGFLEGWFRATYKDANGVQHEIAGSFRLKKNY